MLLSAKKIMGLPVKTKSGTALGKAFDLMIDADRGEICKFIVCDSILAKNILQKELIIDKSQILEIRQDAVIVEDNIEKDTRGELAQA